MWVLVVDDDAAVRDVLRAVLEDTGYRVAEAWNGQEALEILRTSPHPMVVLLDLLMPRLDGAALLRAVTEDALLAARHAFVILTAADCPYIRSLGNLAVPVILKPFDIDDLLNTIIQVASHLLVA